MIIIIGAVLGSPKAPLNLMIHWYSSLGLRRAVNTHSYSLLLWKDTD